MWFTVGTRSVSLAVLASSQSLLQPFCILTLQSGSMESLEAELKVKRQENGKLLPRRRAFHTVGPLGELGTGIVTRSVTRRVDSGALSFLGSSTNDFHSSEAGAAGGTGDGAGTGGGVRLDECKTSGRSNDGEPGSAAVPGRERGDCRNTRMDDGDGERDIGVGGGGGRFIDNGLIAINGSTGTLRTTLRDRITDIFRFSCSSSASLCSSRYRSSAFSSSFRDCTEYCLNRA